MTPKPDPKPKRGMPRSLIFALIPGGFILLVVLMLTVGATRDDEPPAMTEAREAAEERND